MDSSSAAAAAQDVATESSHHETDSDGNVEQTLEIASLPARALAVFVDYLVVNAFQLLFSTSAVAIDFGFFLTLVFGGVYFTLGNSWVFQGRTLGKRAFGLRVLTYRGTSPPYLTLRQSFLRYMALYGGIILLAEIPPQWYRWLGVVGENWVLELPMLLVLCLAVTNVLLVAFTPRRLGIHDLLVSSVVIGAAAEVPEQIKFVTNDGAEGRRGRPTETRLAEARRQRAAIILFFGLLVGGFFWWLGLNHPEPINAVSGKRYALEQKYSFLVLSLDTVILGPQLDRVQFGGVVGVESDTDQSLPEQVHPGQLSVQLIDRGSQQSFESRIEQFAREVTGVVVSVDPQAVAAEFTVFDPRSEEDELRERSFVYDIKKRKLSAQKPT